MEALLAFLAALLALRLAGALAARARETRRGDLAFWSAGLAAYALASGALAWGAAAGWDDRAFRVYYLAGGLLTAPLLACGSLLLVGRRWARPLGYLYAGLSLGVAIAVPISPAITGQSIPEAQEHLELLPARLVAIAGNTLGTVALVVVALATIRGRVLPNALILAGVVVAAAGSAVAGLGEAETSAFVAIAAVLLYLGFQGASGGGLHLRPLLPRIASPAKGEPHGHGAEKLTLVRYRNLVGGDWVDAISGATFESLDPYAAEPWALVPDCGAEDVDRAVRAARAAFDRGPWPQATGRERAKLMRRLAALIAENADELARIETRDNGKLLREMRGQCALLPEWYDYFAGAADKIDGRVIASDKPNFLCYTRKEPIGVVAAVLPWNSPLLLLTFKLAPALAAGCTFVAKPSEQTPASALAFAEFVDEAGFPPGVFNVVTGATESSARHSSRTRASTRSRSPARPRPGSPSRGPRPTRSRGSRSSSAASRRTSSSPTPTSRRPRTAWSRASSRRRARRASPARACSSRPRRTTP